MIDQRYRSASLARCEPSLGRTPLATDAKDEVEVAPMLPSVTAKTSNLGEHPIQGVSLVADTWAQPASPDAAGFRAISPASGHEMEPRFAPATDADIDRAARKAWEAFHAMLDRPAADRAGLLEAIAGAIAALDHKLIERASEETGLGPVRMVAERERTLFTLRMFAGVVRAGEWVEATIDRGEPSRRPLPKPDIRRMLRPLGPVAVFGASNFPLAYGVAGGDTASAIAAGCPVVVKGHPAHPGTGELLAGAVAAAVRQTGFHPGTFSFLHAGGTREREVGQRLIQNSCIRAVGFTGSLAGGLGLAKLARERPDPIPVFAEMGSTNPIFVLPGSAAAEAKGIAERLVSSLANSNGQMCTCPGLIFAVRGGDTETLVRTLADTINEAAPQPMLGERTRANFAARVRQVGGVGGVEVRAGSPAAADSAGKDQPIRCAPVLFRTTFEIFKAQPTLHEEVFGPAAIVVLCENDRQLIDAAAAVQGSLTGTIWASETDSALARTVLTILEQRVGRVIFNGVPTGVEVCASMVHGGPFPATNQAQTTAVGPAAIKRWARPVCYQHTPAAFLPAELRDENTLRIPRVVDGVREEKGQSSKAAEPKS
jgi:2,5-dioxopentanoate dehydrogenase